MKKKVELTHEHFMREALKEAMRAFSLDEIPIGAVLVNENQIIGKGHNLVERMNDVTAHAEIIAVTAASEFFQNKYLKGCTLYVTVEPCLMCAAAIGWAQIAKVVYGTADPKKGFSLFKPSPLHPKTKVMSGVLEEECAGIMRSFFRKKR